MAESIDDPLVALFLLVCDMAINPGAGFPMPIRHFDTFIEDVTPATRFLFICRAIANMGSEVTGAITKYSRAEYAYVSELLSRAVMIDSPLAIAERARTWAHDEATFGTLMAEHETFDFGPADLPVRLLFSHFLDFNSDKFESPEVFCWPGASMAGSHVSPKVVTLFDRHSALFIDKADDTGIFPRVFANKDGDTVHKAFESFYAFNVTYAMISQWIAKPGPFEYGFQWLSSTGTYQELKGFADRNFELAFGVQPDRFEII